MDKTLEKFIIMSGCGRNGKGVVNELVMAMFGQYGYKLRMESLCLTNRNSTNPDIANCNNKRFVVSSECKERYGFDNNIIKLLTGGCEMSARQLYSTNTKVNLCLTLIVECNNKPEFQDTITKADINRLIHLDFPNEFTDDISKVNNINIFEANEYYKTEEFRNEYRSAMFWLLIDTYKENNGKIYVPDNIRKRSLEYFTETDKILKWFRANYKPCEVSEDPRTYLQMQDVFALLKDDQFFKSLSQFDKRKLTKQSLIDKFKEPCLV